ncbi:hypothetical protein MMC31_007941 [Peltigera leucophlebia]|nr:hypothetical protein [Peltigera leucophlebia]
MNSQGSDSKSLDCEAAGIAYFLLTHGRRSLQPQISLIGRGDTQKDIATLQHGKLYHRMRVPQVAGDAGNHVKEAKLESEGKSDYVFVQLDLEVEPVKIGWANMDAVEEIVDLWITPLMWDKDGKFVEGLILAAASGENNFRRVGHFTNLPGPRDIGWIEDAPKQTITLV